MHMHFPIEPPLFPSRASSSHSEKKKSPSSSSASTYSGKSTSSSSSSSSAGTSASNTRSKRHEHDRRAEDGPPLVRTSTLASSPSTSSNHDNSPSSAIQDHSRAHEALHTITGKRVCHGKCPPEFLESYAHREDQQVEIISGDEASTFFIKYLGDHTGKHASSSRSKKTHVPDDLQKVVFAVSGYYRATELVDYYLTWRSDSYQPALKEHEIRLLDEEFKRVARRIDEEYKASRKESDSRRRSHHSNKEHRDRERSRSPTSAKQRKPRPPNLELPSPQSDLRAPDGSAPSPDPPISATSSVISLPYLNMVRGVPLAHRVPLTVTNPDNRLSMVSEYDGPLVDPDASKSEARGANPPAIAVTPPSARASSSQFNLDGAHHHSSGLKPLMKSSASIISTETSSSRSSRSTNSSGGSPVLPLAELDDPDREPTQFLIVLLGNRLEEGLSWHGIERQTSVRSNTSSATKERMSPWVGPLAKADNSLQPPVSQKRRSYHSGHTHGHGHESDDEESHDGNTSWHDGPVVPFKPILEPLGGYLPSASEPNLAASAYPYSPPVIPHHIPTPPSMSGHGTPYAMGPASVMSSPAASTVHLGYASSDITPRMSMNGQYLPAWAMQSRSAGGSPMARPDSRVLPGVPMYAASSYMRPAY